MNTAQLPSIKHRILHTNLADTMPIAQKILRADDPIKIRELLDRLNA